jgi:type II secretory pathway component PulM
MINIFKVIDFIKEQWLGFVVILLWVIFLIVFSKDTSKNEAKIEKEVKKVEQNEARVKVIVKEIKSIDTKIKVVKVKGDEKIKYIDTMSVSELQGYFSDRYKK